MEMERQETLLESISKGRAKQSPKSIAEWIFTNRALRNSAHHPAPGVQCDG